MKVNDDTGLLVTEGFCIMVGTPNEATTTQPANITAVQDDTPFLSDSNERTLLADSSLSTMYVFFYHKTYNHTTSVVPPPITVRSVV